jgi:hypothetical protein
MGWKLLEHHAIGVSKELEGQAFKGVYWVYRLENF